MNSTNVITRSLILNASKTQVWNLLTNPDETKKYMFNCEAHSNWIEGSTIRWKGNYQGYESGEKGIILEIAPNQHLKYSSIDPNFGIEDITKNYLHITYDLVEQNGKTELITTIENFNDDPNRMEHISKGWDTIVLPAIAKIFS